MRRTAYLLPIIVLVAALGFTTALPKPAAAQVSVGISVRIGPPVLPVYVQPICPGPDYIWIPGYWAWSQDGYYWVPGTWVLAPEPGLLWTPGWWGFNAGLYMWHPGYWGPHVGFYGGINYGHGYFGFGYVGGEWRGRHFYYNRAVTNVNVRVVRNVYENRNYRRLTTGRIAYNGGPRGVRERPTPEQQRWDRERHVERTREQERHDMQARDNRAFRYSDNHGRPPIGATQRPGQFHPPANQNRPRQERQTRPNTRQPQRPNYAPPRNQPRSGAQPRNEPAPRGNQPRSGAQPRNQPAPRGNQPQARPRNEQPRGNQGGDRGHDNRDGGNDRGHGHEDGRR